MFAVIESTNAGLFARRHWLRNISAGVIVGVVARVARGVGIVVAAAVVVPAMDEKNASFVSLAASTMNSEAPRMAQFTVIKGRNTPSALYRAGMNLSRNISRICTMAAITPI